MFSVRRGGNHLDPILRRVLVQHLPDLLGTFTDVCRFHLKGSSVERAVCNESTAEVERAVSDESTATHERAVPAESTVYPERAVSDESTDTHERAALRESTVS